MIQLDDPCDICGDVGFVENVVTCFLCKIAREHGYCMREVLFTIPEIWFCEECQLSKAIVFPESVIVEDVPMSSTSITSESVCTSPLLKLSRKSVDHKNEMASKSNTSKTLSPVRFLKNKERSGSAYKQVAARIGNVKKPSGPSKSEHLMRNLVSSLDQSSTMATVSKSIPTGFKATPAKLYVEKIKAMSSTSVTSECLCTSPLLKLSRKSVDPKNEMASKSNTSKTLSPGRFLKNKERSGSACEQVAARIGNVKKSSGPSKSEHLVRNLVSSPDQSITKATVSKSSPTRFKAAPAKLSVKKIQASHDHRKLGHCSARFSSTTQRKANQTSKILKYKKTSATCEKETHDTFMPGEKIETSQSQQRDREEVSPEGLGSLPVDTIASTLTESDLEKIALEYQIDTNRYHLSLPKPSQRANSYFPCKHTFCIYADAFKAGLRLPLHPLIPEILDEFGVAPTQIPPNSWRVLVCFISFCYSQKITPTVNLFRVICSLKDHSWDSKGWWFFSARVGFKLFEGFPSSIKGWRNRFFIISTSERDTLGVNTKWGHPNSAANQLPTLSAKEVKSLDDLVAAATNNPPDIRVLLSEEALIQAGISSTLLKSKGSEGELKQRHSLSQSGLGRALKRKRAATEAVKSTWSALPCQEPILVDIDLEDQPERKSPKEPQQPLEQTDLLQPTELTNRPQEIVPPVRSAPLFPYDLPHEVLPQQASSQSNVQRIAGASAPIDSSIYFGTATGDLPPSNAKVMHTGSVEYTREQSVFTHPYDCDSVAHKDTLDIAQELMCQAMENVTWKMGVSQKLIKMHREINTLKGERNALIAELESEKMAVAELESARKTTVELQSLTEEQTQRLENEVERLKIRLKETEEKARTWRDQFAKLKRRLKQAENRAASAERKVVVAEEKWRQSEMTKSRVAEETLKNLKASQEFQHEVEDCDAEAYGMGLEVAIKKIKTQFPDLDLSMIDFYSED